jgi:hypothetical protein
MEDKSEDFRDLVLGALHHIEILALGSRDWMLRWEMMSRDFNWSENWKEIQEMEDCSYVNGGDCIRDNERTDELG